jgi:hypothetical protein
MRIDAVSKREIISHSCPVMRECELRKRKRIELRIGAVGKRKVISRGCPVMTEYELRERKR